MVVNWYKLLKFAGPSDYWVLPDGRSIECHTKHVVDGWDFLTKIEPNINPNLRPGFDEDYDQFAKRGWIRISGGNSVQLFNGFATPAQAKTISSLLSPNMLVYFDLPNRQSILLPDDQAQLIEDVVTGTISPIQIKMRPDKYLPV